MRYDKAVERLRELYLTGYYEEEKDSGYSKRALDAGAEDDFETHLENISTYLREDVREEEMRIAGEINTELLRDTEHLTTELKQARALALSELLPYLSLITDKSSDFPDAEAWAYQDGWNAAIALLKEKIQVVISDPPRIEMESDASSGE